MVSTEMLYKFINMRLKSNNNNKDSEVISTFVFAVISNICYLCELSLKYHLFSHR